MDLMIGSAVAKRGMVRRADAVGVLPTGIEERLPGLIYALERWALWCESFKVHIGYRKHVSGMMTGGSDVVRAEDQRTQQDARNCELVDTAVDDLPHAQRAAINRRYGLMHAAVYRFPRDNYAELLDEAHRTLLKTVSKKGVDI